MVSVFVRGGRHTEMPAGKKVWAQEAALGELEAQGKSRISQSLQRQDEAGKDFSLVLLEGAWPHDT